MKKLFSALVLVGALVTPVWADDMADRFEFHQTVAKMAAQAAPATAVAPATRSVNTAKATKAHRTATPTEVAADPILSETVSEPTSVHRMVTEVARRVGVRPSVAHAIVQIESGYNCRARHRGTVGIMQVNPRTARGVGVHGNLMDCRTGLEAGLRYLKQAMDLYGDSCGAYSAYNTGIYKTGRCTAYGRRVKALASSSRLAMN